jgi:HlyD family secretion protein
MPERIHLTLAMLAAGLGLAAGCGPSGGSVATSTTAPGPVAIGTVQPQWKSLRRVVEQPGALQAYQETKLFARVPGYVFKLRPEIDIGARVAGPKYDDKGKETQPGEVLAELVVPELVEEAKRKQALVLQTEAELEQAVKALAAADATVGVAKAAVIEAQAMFDRWESESKRMTSLAKDRIVDVQNSEETLSKFRSADGRLALAHASVRKAEADHDRARADISAARARIQVAMADAARAEAMLGYAKIRAPFDGIVTRRKVNTGDFVQPTGGQGDWLFTVAQVDPIRAMIGVPEADSGMVRDQAEVKLVVQALPGVTLQGKVTRTSWALDPGARTLQVEIDLPNKDGRLRPGMYIYGHIASPLPSAWLLPSSAVARQNDAMVCYRIEGGKAIRTPVLVGSGNGQLVEVLKLQHAGTPPTWHDWTGQEVVALQAVGLSDGQEVQLAASGK